MDDYRYSYDFIRKVLSREKDGVVETRSMELHNSDEFLQAIEDWKNGR